MGGANSPMLSEELGQYFGETDVTIAQQFARVTFFFRQPGRRASAAPAHADSAMPRRSSAPTEVGEYMVSHLPNARLVTLRTTGHCPQLSAPLETLAAIQDFVRAA